MSFGCRNQFAWLVLSTLMIAMFVSLNIQEEYKKNVRKIFAFQLSTIFLLSFVVVFNNKQITNNKQQSVTQTNKQTNKSSSQTINARQRNSSFASLTSNSTPICVHITRVLPKYKAFVGKTHELNNKKWIFRFAFWRKASNNKIRKQFFRLKLMFMNEKEEKRREEKNTYLSCQNQLAEQLIRRLFATQILRRYNWQLNCCSWCLVCI